MHKTLEIEGTVELVRTLKANMPDLPLILGEPLASSSGDYFVRECFVDAVIVGEGEIAFLKYLDVLSGNGELSDVPGLHYLQDGNLIENPIGKYIDNINSLNIAWDLLSPTRYFLNSGVSNFSMIKK